MTIENIPVEQRPGMPFHYICQHWHDDRVEPTLSEGNQPDKTEVHLELE